MIVESNSFHFSFVVAVTLLFVFFCFFLIFFLVFCLSYCLVSVIIKILLFLCHSFPL